CIALFLESESEIVVGASVVRLKIDGRAKLANRALRLPQGEQHAAQIRMRFREVRLDSQRPAEVLARPAQVALLATPHPQIVLRFSLGKIRVRTVKALDFGKSSIGRGLVAHLAQSLPE